MKVVINVVTRILCVSVLIGLLAIPLAAEPVAASAQSDICSGLGEAGGSCNGGSGPINHTLANIANLISVIAGIAAVIMLIVGGLKYITSNGDANNISSAKSTIMYALIGVVIVALAQAIVHFVLGKVG